MARAAATTVALLVLGGIFGTSTAFGAVYEPGKSYRGNTPGNFLNGSPLLAKYDLADQSTGSGSWSGGSAPGNYTDAFTLTFDVFKDQGQPDQEVIGGTWSFAPTLVTGANSVLYPTKVAVKAGKNWFFYENALGVTSGDWSTVLLRSAGVSHISFYDTALTAVPLPAAVWLFGSALLGLAGIGYNRRKVEQS